ncbi:MAG: metal-dependent hydrolase [Archaeoglobaceae archaeon]
MDLLTHIFLPLTAAYVLKREAFPSHYYLLLGLFAVVPDFDKFTGEPYLHSLIGVGAIAVVLLVGERIIRGTNLYSGIAGLFLFSHLLLDILEGNTVPLLYPFVTTGVGLTFPLKVIFHSPTFSFADAPAKLVCDVPHMGNTYLLFSGYGVASALLFTMIYWGLRKYK